MRRGLASTNRKYFFGLIHTQLLCSSDCVERHSDGSVGRWLLTLWLMRAHCDRKQPATGQDRCPSLRDACKCLRTAVDDSQQPTRRFL